MTIQPVPPLRRSCLSVPGINQRALEKTRSLDCDVVIFDLEDSVSSERKAEARHTLRGFFEGTPPCLYERVIRINGLHTAERQDDLRLVAELQPDAVLLPKVESLAEIDSVAAFLKDASSEVRIWAMVETPMGILRLQDLASGACGPQGRLDCFVVGLNDLRKETGVPERSGRVFLVPWMMQVVLAARAHGLNVIDSVFNDFRNADAFAAECAQGNAMGFDGKMLIHPTQIEVTNNSFGPSPEALVEAKAIIAAFAAPEAAMLNVINMNGRMIERLHLEQAEKLVARMDVISCRKV